MCDVPLIRTRVVSAQTAFLGASVLVLAAIITSSNMFTSGGSPVLLGIALALTLSAMICIGLVTRAAGLCAGCAGAGDQVQVLAIALAVSLTAASTAIAICIIPSAVPFAGAVLAAALAITLAIVAGLFFGLLDALSRLELCILAATSTVTRVAAVLAGAAWDAAGSAPCTAANC